MAERLRVAVLVRYTSEMAGPDSLSVYGTVEEAKVASGVNDEDWDEVDEGVWWVDTEEDSTQELSSGWEIYWRPIVKI